MTTVKPGTLILINNEVRTVERVEGDKVFYKDPDDGCDSLDFIAEYVSPVQPGDRLWFGANAIRVVTDVRPSVRGDRYLVVYRETNGNRDWSPSYLLDLESAEKMLVKEEEVTEARRDKPFPAGSKVRFRNDVTYTAGDWDGELQELAPDDGSETLHFGPDLFELVEGPPVPVGSAARQNQLGHNVLVTENTGDKVRFIRRDGSEGTVSSLYFHENYTVLA